MPITARPQERPGWHPPRVAAGRSATFRNTDFVLRARTATSHAWAGEPAPSNTGVTAGFVPNTLFTLNLLAVEPPEMRRNGRPKAGVPTPRPRTDAGQGPVRIRAAQQEASGGRGSEVIPICSRPPRRRPRLSPASGPRILTGCRSLVPRRPGTAAPRDASRRAGRRGAPINKGAPTETRAWFTPEPRSWSTRGWGAATTPLRARGVPSAVRVDSHREKRRRALSAGCRAGSIVLFFLLGEKPPRH